MANDHAASIQGVALRVCQLNLDGTPMVGTTTAWHTNAFMKFGFTPQYTSGTEVEEKGADGNVCVYYRAADVLKAINFTLGICAPDPELYQMLTGGTILTAPGNPTEAMGYASADIGVDGTPNGVAMEVFSKAIVAGRPAVVNPYWRWIFPFAKMKFSGDRTMENGSMASNFEGWGYGNAEYGAGAAGDWEYTTAAPFQYARAASAPLGVNGYLAVTAVGHANAVQTLTITGTPAGGTFTVSKDGQTTAPVAYNASAATLQTALELLSTIGSGNVLVTGSAGGPYTITFQGSLANTTIAAMTASGTGLTGGASPNVVVAVVNAGS